MPISVFPDLTVKSSIAMTTLVCIGDFEQHAHSVLPKNALDYYRSGAGAEETLIHNRRAFSRYFEF